MRHLKKVDLMTNQQILEKALQKAIDGGYEETTNYRVSSYDGRLEIQTLRYTDVNGNKTWDAKPVSELIFNHDFAKALWGEYFANFSEGRSGDTLNLQIENWKGHLANMVIADDPIKYLGENI